MGVQILEIAGEKMAVLTMDEYQRLLELAEDQADALAADRAEQRRLAGEEYLPIEMVDRLLSGENALRIWRQHRGMTLDELSQATGVGQSMLSSIENGKRLGKPSTWRRLATALSVDLDDIVPDEQ